MVLLHSGVCDRRMWDPQFELLQAAGYRVLRPDFPGYGDTPVHVDSYNVAEDVRDLLDSLQLERVVLVGSSFGGRIAQEVAARWPDRVSALALICAARRHQLPSSDLEAFGDQEDVLIAAGDIGGAVELNLKTWLGPLADHATREKVAMMQRHAFEVQLAAEAEPEVEFESRDVDYDVSAVQAPTLVVSGGYDLECFREVADYLAAQIHGARHVIFDWAGHLPSLESPARFNRILLEFLTEVSPTGVR